MAQLNVYVPDKIEKLIRKEAQDRGESISAYLTELIKSHVSPDQWQEKLLHPGGRELGGRLSGDRGFALK